ncbi:hypothetical protein ACH5RR_008613 [Cinchona calisaya]|uniref:Uncharacterized protein n=1 Tax=Cinchona calisaya TaxID=153742 RepID=A0ABD3ABV8_9GENT
MFKVQYLVDPHIQYAIRLGESWFWFSNWLGKGSLADLMGDIPYPDLKLKDVYSNDGGWTLGLVEHFLSEEVKSDIMHFPIFFSEGTDKHFLILLLVVNLPPRLLSILFSGRRTLCCL